MTGDLRRERVRRDQELTDLLLPSGQDSAAMLGTVVTASTTPGNYLKWNPQVVLGTETEGGAGSFTTRSFDLRALFLGPGTAVAGDQLVFRHVRHRWVCEKDTGGPAHITVPGCPCLIPATIYMSVIRPDANFGMFQDATIQYGPVPAALVLLSMGANAYISTTTFIDGLTGDTFWYRFYCSGGYFCISRVYATSAYGTPFADTVRYRWIGGQPGNTCTPFLMSVGKIFPGGDPSSVVSLSG